MVESAVTAPLRHAVLRPHWTFEQFAAHLDDAPHVAVMEGDRVLACASMREEPMPDDPRPGDWRLRGMASDPALRGAGHGATALRAALDFARERGGRRVWCNARTGALGFYEKHGFTAVGDEFDLPDAGPHFLAYVEL